MKKNSLIKFVSEFLPVLCFFVAYKLSDMITATSVLIVTSLFGLLLHRIYKIKIPPMLLFTVIIVTVFGGITILSKDAMFIKMKPTFIYLCFAGILAFGLFKGKLYLKTVLGEQLKLPDHAWQILSKRFIAFFILTAILNEFIWRTFSENFWIHFKSFGAMPIFIVFMLLQIPVIKKYKH